MSSLVLATALSLTLLSREPAPGEVVRVVASSETPLTSVEGTFGGDTLFFVAAQDATSWSAWAVIDLDAKVGRRVAAVRARTADGSEIRARASLDLTKKTFPEQSLTVKPKYVEPSKEALARIESERTRLAAIYAKRTPLPVADAPFTKPVSGDPTSAFGLRRVFNGKPRSPHSGLDLRAAEGTPVLASGSGDVVFAGDLYFSGLTVILDHGGGLFTIYAHLSRIDVKEGERASREQILGLSGATGRVTGPHLHWGAKVGNRIFDPRGLLDGSLF